jgi:hypothetical protein
MSFYGDGFHNPHRASFRAASSARDSCLARESLTCGALCHVASDQTRTGVHSRVADPRAAATGLHRASALCLRHDDRPGDGLVWGGRWVAASAGHVAGRSRSPLQIMARRRIVFLRYGCHAACDGAFGGSRGGVRCFRPRPSAGSLRPVMHDVIIDRVLDRPDDFQLLPESGIRHELVGVDGATIAGRHDS